MKESKILKSMYESNNKTLKMLICLLNKWHDKNYNLTDEEWETIQHYKSLLESFFYDKLTIEKLIKDNESSIKKYS